MTDTIRLSDRLELTPTLTPGWYVLRQSGAVVGANLPQSAADALIAACNPPRYDLPPGVIRSADGTMVAQARTAVDLGWEFKGTDGDAEDRWFKSGPLNHGAWVEVRPTAANPLKPLPDHTFPLPDGTLACFRRDAAKLREAGATVYFTDGVACMNERYDADAPSMVLRVEFPPTPKTETVALSSALGRVRQHSKRPVIGIDTETQMYRVSGDHLWHHADADGTVEVLATDGAL